MKVIEAVRALRVTPDLHDKKVYGLIDRDFRAVEQLNALKDEGVFSITLNEIENLFLAPEIVEMVSGYLSKLIRMKKLFRNKGICIQQIKARVNIRYFKYRMHRHLGEKFGLIKITLTM